MKIKLATLLMFFCVLAFSQTAKVKVQIVGFENNQGWAMMAIYNSDQQFLKEGYKQQKAKIQDQKATWEIVDLPPGEYAIGVFHDENGNLKMDTNMLGIPKEAYACSNNAKGFLGPPKFKDAKFTLKEGETLTLTIQI